MKENPPNYTGRRTYVINNKTLKINRSERYAILLLQQLEHSTLSTSASKTNTHPLTNVSIYFGTETYAHIHIFQHTCTPTKHTWNAIKNICDQVRMHVFTNLMCERRKDRNVCLRQHHDHHLRCVCDRRFWRPATTDTGNIAGNSTTEDIR